MSTGSRVVPHVTCLGCGCACDDIVVTVSAGTVTATENACALGTAWFGDGVVPAMTAARGAAVTLDQALDAAESLLRGARQPLLLLAADLTCEAQRVAVAIADAVGATIDTLAVGMRELTLASQRRGRAATTLGELRHRADTLLFWGIDPAPSHPRFLPRFVDAPGMYVPNGRAGRSIVAVDVGDAYGPRDADLRIRIDPLEEAGALAALRAMMLHNDLGDVLRDDLLRRMARLTERLEHGSYIVVLYDADAPRLRVPGIAEGLVALTQALNEHHRAGACALRAGGNRAGADAVLTWQTGFPSAVEFSRGAPRYVPESDTAARLAAGAFDTLLIAGDARAIDMATEVPCVAIGPRASEGRFAGARVAIDTGVAGIHESGLAFRLDDIALPLRQVMTGPPTATAVLTMLRDRLTRTRG